MPTQSTSIPDSWRLAFRLGRAALSVACLAASLVTQGFTPYAVVWLVFTLYAAATLFWHSGENGNRALLPFVADLTFFLAWLNGPGGRMVVVSCLFFLLVVLTAAVLHSWRETLAAGAAILLFLVITRPLVEDQLLAAFATGSLIAVVLTLQKNRYEAGFADSVREIAAHRANAENAGEAERKRIAADFHDGPLQSFISFQMRLQIVKRMFQRDQADGMRELEQLQELCRNQVAELRAFIRGMRPPDEEGAGLLTASGRLVDLFQKDTGIVATFHRGAPVGTEDPEASTEILQLIREALNNVQKHSKASRVAVSMGRVEGALEITIEDDGTGFLFAGTYNLDELDALHLGPVSIKRRVRNLGGELTVDSRPGHGASLQIRTPL